MSCELHCEQGWLPLDRDDEHDEADQSMLLTFPTQFTPCPRCNPAAITNSDLYRDLDLYRSQDQEVTNEHREHR